MDVDSRCMRFLFISNPLQFTVKKAVGVPVEEHGLMLDLRNGDDDTPRNLLQHALLRRREFSAWEMEEALSLVEPLVDPDDPMLWNYDCTVASLSSRLFRAAFPRKVRFMPTSVLCS